LVYHSLLTEYRCRLVPVFGLMRCRLWSNDKNYLNITSLRSATGVHFKIAEMNSVNNELMLYIMLQIVLSMFDNASSVFTVKAIYFACPAVSTIVSSALSIVYFIWHISRIYCNTWLLFIQSNIWQYFKCWPEKMTIMIGCCWDF